MKQTIKELLIFTILVISFFYISSYNNYISNQIIYSVNIWLTKIVPTLFPTFILVDVIYASNIPKFLENKLHINYIYILSIISGSPSNAYILNNYNIELTKLLSTTQYTSLVFALTYLTNIFNKTQAIIIIILNILTNIILIIFLKPPKITYINQTNSYINTILKSINKSILTLVNILGTIIFFNILPINLIQNNYLKSFLLSILEITSSLTNLSIINIPFNFKIILTCISLSTCGLCIFCQIKSIVNNQKCNYQKYLKYRLLHLTLFTILCLLTFNLLLK